MSDVAKDLARFDDDFQPTQGRKPNLDTLPDGDYEMEIVDCDLVRTKKTLDPILRMTLRVLTGAMPGMVVEHGQLIKTQVAANVIGGDLMMLGLDAHLWVAPDRPFSQELDKAIPQLAGRKFKSRKVAEKATDGKVYARLYINGPITSASLNGVGRAGPRPMPGSSAAAAPAESRKVSDIAF